VRKRPLHARSGLSDYDAARWTDWVPRLERTHSAGGMSTLLQVVPAGARGANEVDVARSLSETILFFVEGGGQLDYRIGNRPYRATTRRWSGALLPTGIDSWWASTGEDVPRVFNLYLDRQLLVDIAQADSMPATDLAPMPLIDDPLLSGLAQMVYNDLAQPHPPSRLIWDTYAQALALRLLRLNGRVTPGVAALATDWRIRRSIEEIEARLHEDLGLMELAAAVGLSPSHYASLFRSATGMPPHAWLVKRRIERACEMLTSPAVTITDIAFALGFASSQHFATMFRKHTGVTPTEWRRRRMM